MVNLQRNLEVEIKLQLGSFTNYLKLIGSLGPMDSEERHINGFFDSEERHLAAAGWALRVRAEDQRGLVTLKSLAKPRGVALVREEIEGEVARSQALEVLGLHMDVLSLAVAPTEFIKQEFPEIKLARLVRFNNTRQKKQFRLGEYDHILEIDKTEFSDGSVDYELEVELRDVERVDVVESQLRKLFDSLGILFGRQSESKFDRALARASLV